MGLKTWLGLKRRRATVPPRSRIFFLHIPKTGGVSLGATLAEAYPFWAVMPDPCMCARNYGFYPPLDAVIDAMRFRPERVHYVWGHFHMSCAGLLGPEAKTVTVLRDPVERMISYYRFWYGRQKLTLEAFKEKFHADGFKLRYDNEMCRRLAGSFDYTTSQGAQDRLHAMFKSEISDPVRLLDDARRALDKCDFVGTFDNLPTLVKRLSAEVERDLKLGHHNKSSAPDEIADIVRESVIRENQLDMALYEHARAIAAG
jgi:hypothetical protein